MCRERGLVGSNSQKNRCARSLARVFALSPIGRPMPNCARRNTGVRLECLFTGSGGGTQVAKKKSSSGKGAKKGGGKKKAGGSTPPAAPTAPPQPPTPPTPPTSSPAPGSGGYKRTKNIPDAEQFTRSLGIGFVRFNDPNPAFNQAPVIEEIANNVNEGLDTLTARGLKDLPRRIETERKFFEEAGKAKTAWAVFINNPMDLSGLQSNWMHLNKAILINPRSDWAQVGAEMAARRQSGEYSTGDPHHILYHEMGHFLLDHDRPRRNPAADNQVLQQALANLGQHLSGRARAGATEFVAETFAQIIVGTTPVDPQVLALYQQLGGRMI